MDHWTLRTGVRPGPAACSAATVEKGATVTTFATTTAPVRAGRPRIDEVFDLSALPTCCRLELALVLQRRHDERGRGLRPTAVRPVGDARPTREACPNNSAALLDGPAVG